MQKMKYKIDIMCSCGVALGNAYYDEKINTYNLSMETASNMGKHIRLGHEPIINDRLLNHGN